jgi:hypothetical protein
MAGAEASSAPIDKAAIERQSIDGAVIDRAVIDRAVIDRAVIDGARRWIMVGLRWQSRSCGTAAIVPQDTSRGKKPKKNPPGGHPAGFGRGTFCRLLA